MTKNTQPEIKNPKTRALLANGEHTKEGMEMLGFLQKFERIEQKESCMRVKFLDWLSNKLQQCSVEVKNMSTRIDSPCVLKLPDTKVTPVLLKKFANRKQTVEG